jgi:hypothetical protein
MAQPIDKDGAKQNVEKVDKGTAHVDGEHKQQVHHPQKMGIPSQRFSTIWSILVRLGEVDLPRAGGNVVDQTVGIAIATVGHGNVDVFAQYLVDAVALFCLPGAVSSSDRSGTWLSSYSSSLRAVQRWLGGGTLAPAMAGVNTAKASSISEG